MSELEDIVFEGEEPSEEATPVETPEPEKAEEPAEPEVKPETEEPKEEPEKMVPLSAMLAERSARQAYEKLLEQQPRQKSEPVKLPDPIEDADGYAQALSRQFQQQQENMRLDMSQSMAEEVHGAEVVSEALQAAQQMGIHQRFSSERHPYGALVKWHKEQQSALEIQNAGGLEAYRAKIKAEALREFEADLVAKQASAGKAPASLAGQPNLGQRTGPAAPEFTPLDDLLGD